MKSLILIGSFLLSAMAHAESATYDVKGMHCESCAQEIEAHVCKMEGVKTCKVELTDEKKKMGKVSLTTEEGKAIDAKKVEELVSAAGNYHIVKSPTKKK